MNAAQQRVESKKIPRISSATYYNKKNVPVFVPDGFPAFAKPYMENHTPDSEMFAKAVATVQEDLGLKVDGLCGPATIAAMAAKDRERVGQASILIGPRAYPLEGARVVTFIEDQSLDVKARVRQDKIRQLVLHYDVTFNSRSTLSVLQKRGLSYHFLIDGDGEATIYQTHNPTLSTCFHARSANKHSVGICLNNPAEPEYQRRDANQRGRERPVKIDEVHGGHVELLDFFPEQKERAKQLVDLLCGVLGVPHSAPKDLEGNFKKGVINADTFDGVIGHYHLTTSKIDPAPLKWEDLDL